MVKDQDPAGPTIVVVEDPGRRALQSLLACAGAVLAGVDIRGVHITDQVPSEPGRWNGWTEEEWTAAVRDPVPAAPKNLRGVTESPKRPRPAPEREKDRFQQRRAAFARGPGPAGVKRR